MVGVANCACSCAIVPGGCVGDKMMLRVCVWTWGPRCWGGAAWTGLSSGGMKGLTVAAVVTTAVALPGGAPGGGAVGVRGCPLGSRCWGG